MGTSASSSDSDQREGSDAEPSGNASDQTHVSSAGDALTESGRSEAVPSSPATLMPPGQRIRDYELLELLGRGGMGSVWKARHTRLKKLVALKLLPQDKTADTAAVARFHREMEAVGALRHPHIIEALDAGEERGTHYLVMEFVDGIEVGELARKAGPLPVPDACEIARQTALGLQHADEHNLVHRDIKPSNLLLTRTDLARSRSRETSDPTTRTFTNSGAASSASTSTVKILDLGLALLHGDQPGVELTSTGQVMGTLDYIAPEQLADTHAVDIRADLYSLGCTLFRLLTGEPPFSGPTLNTAAKKMYAHSFTPAPKLIDRRADVPPELSALVDRLLSKKPDERFAAPHEVATALAPFCAGHDLAALLELAGSGRLSATPAACAPALVPAPTPMALNSDAPQASDPFASTVIPGRPVAPRQESRMPLDAHHVDSLPATTDALPTESPPRFTSIETTTSTARSALLSRSDRATWKRLIAVLFVVLLLSLGLIPFLKRDANPRNPGESVGVSPRTDSQTTDVRGLTPPGSPESDSSTLLPTDPDRAAAEWVLSKNGNVTVSVDDKESGVINERSKLPEARFALRRIHIEDRLDVTDEDLASIVELSLLDSLFLPGCVNVTDRGATLLSRQRSMKLVFVQGTRITDAGVADLIQCPTLTGIGLGAHQITQRSAAAIQHNQRINSLNLNDCRDAALRVVLECRNLQILNLFRCEFRPSTWTRLSDALPKLNTIYCTQLPMNDADLASLIRLPNLVAINLASTPNVTNIGLSRLAAANNLKLLHISQTAVTALGLADFREAKPECEIVWDGVDHRAVAEWVWSVGGKVRLAGRSDEWLAGDAEKSSPVAPRQESRTSNDADRANDAQPTTTPNARSAIPVAERQGYKGPLFLTGVDLSECQTINDADLARLADCTTIRTLDLHHTKLTGACLPHLAKLERLENLFLSGLPVQDDDLPLLAGFPRLANLQLHETQVTEAGMSHLARCSELMILHLKKTHVTDEGVKRLATLPKLGALDLTGCPVTDSVADVLLEFPALFSLGLNETPITDTALHRLGQRKSPKWHRLYLSGTKTTDAGLEPLSAQTDLVTLECGETQVTPDAFAEFVRQHPRLGMTRPTETSDAPDLRVVCRVLAAGGIVSIVVSQPVVAVPLAAGVNHFGRTTRRADDLPELPFRVAQIDLRPADNKVTDETVAEIGRLELLSEFHTTNAVLSDAAVVVLSSAPKLTTLELTGTPLSPATVRHLATRTELEVLGLHNTGLTGEAGQSLAALTKLKFLYLGSNPLTDADIGFVEQLPELEMLEISGAQIVNRGWASLAKLPKLKHLQAYNMPVGDAALEYAARIELLEVLHVGGGASEVSDAGLAHLRSHSHLRELSLGHCARLTDAGLESLAELPALETLHLNNTRITDAGLKHLARIKTLKSLIVTDCQLSEAALDDLQDALPWCRITSQPDE